MLNNKISKAVRLAIAFGTASTAVFSANSMAADEGAKKVERIQVTGSRITRTDLEGASPVITITNEQMTNLGFHNVQDVLENITSVTGALTTQSIHGFTPAASSVSLRNAGSNRTLTLVNGKRLVQYPKASGGTSTFQNTGNLPTEAISRIDILTAGASAIYGADAVGGVINIILKNNFEGVAAKVKSTGYTEGGGSTNQFSFSAGASSDKMNVSLFLEYEDSKVIKATDREEFGVHTDKVALTERSSYSSYGARIAGPFNYTLPKDECNTNGFFFDDANARCGFDRSSMRDIKPETTKAIALTTFNYQLSDEHELYGRVQYSRGTSERSIEAMGIDDVKVTVAGDKATLKLDSDEKTFNKSTFWGGQFASSDFVDGDYTVIRRLHEFGPRGNETTSIEHGFNLGLQGELTSDISYQLEWAFNNATVDVLSETYATRKGMFEFLSAGANGFNLLKPFSDADVESVAYVPFEKNKSSQNNFSFNLSGSAMDLPAGTLDYSAGIEYTKQTFATNSDTESKKGAILTTGGSSGAGARDFTSLYTEMRADVTETLVLNAALRFDDYSDFGSNLTPQVSLEYRPNDELLVRATYADVFRAPDMQRVYGDPSNGFATVIDFKRCQELGGVPGTELAGTTECHEHHIDSITGGNKDLKAETGYSVNLGIVYGTEAFDATVDVWKWELDDMVDSVSSTRIAKEYQTYGANITRDANGSITLINATAQNLSFSTVSGVDFDTGYRFDMNDLGMIRVGLRGTYLLKSESKLDATSPVRDELNDFGLLPELKLNTSVVWNMEDVKVSIFGRYTDGVGGTNYNSLKDLTSNTVNGGDITVASNIVWNASVKYNYNENFDILVGSSNIFNKGPNLDPSDASWPHYPRSLYNANGRSVYAQFDLRF
ncbi:TonB-dependent receptor plug domain-containing protein [Pseudoalteromonas nigrifaciens]|uniref:TonB-dependent receptor plug domain-containing protein n=1 Tax=Pseudoalteromonas nigrifaciens TaxID=28109 RepID=UPI003FD2A236